jgi:hypothetical protein
MQRQRLMHLYNMKWLCRCDETCRISTAGRKGGRIREGCHRRLTATSAVFVRNLPCDMSLTCPVLEASTHTSYRRDVDDMLIHPGSLLPAPRCVECCNVLCRICCGTQLTVTRRSTPWLPESAWEAQPSQHERKAHMAAHVEPATRCLYYKTLESGLRLTSRAPAPF